MESVGRRHHWPGQRSPSCLIHPRNHRPAGLGLLGCPVGGNGSAPLGRLRFLDGHVRPSAQIEKLGPAGVSTTVHLDLLDAG